MDGTRERKCWDFDCVRPSRAIGINSFCYDAARDIRIRAKIGKNREERVRCKSSRPEVPPRDGIVRLIGISER